MSHPFYSFFLLDDDAIFNFTHQKLIEHSFRKIPSVSYQTRAFESPLQALAFFENLFSASYDHSGRHTDTVTTTAATTVKTTVTTTLTSRITPTVATKQDKPDTIAKSQLSARPVRNILMVDINMPVMDGFEFIDRFVGLNQVTLHATPKEDSPHRVSSHPLVSSHPADTGQPTETPFEIYLLSSSLASVDLNRAQKLTQLRGYLEKPLSESTLLEILSINSI